MKQAAKLITLSTLCVALAACIADEELGDAFDGLTDDDVGAEADVDEVELDAEATAGCRFTSGSKLQSTINLSYGRGTRTVSFFSVNYSFRNRYSNAGNNNKAGIEIQIRKNGKWQSLTGDYNYWKRKIKKNGSDRHTINRAYFVGSYDVRLKIRASWDLKFQGDPAQHCYRYI